MKSNALEKNRIAQVFILNALLSCYSIFITNKIIHVKFKGYIIKMTIIKNGIFTIIIIRRKFRRSVHC